ncbi:MAG: valine--tRNA ligase [Puniceicoccales bacterium]|jgi:valyl-tRNA synthetase|nr:valine--tRNA ligase [Puniceicoccales bacterium]
MIEVSYSPSQLEQKWYQLWSESNIFTRKVSPQKSSCTILIPPPNVTGILHMGHILNNTIQDVLIRRARQKDRSAFWIPGTDHAGISLQIKMEKELAKQQLTRYDVGREAFVELAQEWRQKHGSIILEQLEKLGVSCDWSAIKYTLDPDYSHAVLFAFVKFYQQGYIYRGLRLINWCPVSMTALSDEEVIMRQQNSFLYYIKYEFVEQPGEFLVIATTRPETIMGDVAIAVHPSDKRYQNFIGLHCWRPIVREAIPIIADEAVLQDFGTGALKITPAHDIVDFEIGQRHKLDAIGVIDKNGKLNTFAGPEFAGMDRFEARKKVAEYLNTQGLLLREEACVNNVGFSERAGVPIEPMLSEQWFLKYPCVEEAKLVVQKGLIHFCPERWAKTYMHWLENIKDWCISRQLWWGHRIPVWYRKGTDRNDTENWHISVDGPEDPENWEQDEDVLDTWFSSAIWPLATLGWPDEKMMNTMNFNYFYPTADLVTGPDIIFFWVARMIMFSLHLLDTPKMLLSEEGEGDEEEIRATRPYDSSQEVQSPEPVSFDSELNTSLESEWKSKGDYLLEKYIPFKNVYFTGIIRDHLGRKMSKSLGNSPDPLDLIEKYGADGIRIGLLSMAPNGQDILFSEDRVAQGKKLCTKLWNSFRFRQQNSMEVDRSSVGVIIERIDVHDLEADDIAVLGKLLNTINEFEEAMDDYEFNRAVQILQTFFWNHYCDWYIEVSKSRINNTVLAIHDFILYQLLLLFHPFIPFITEELWHAHGYGTGFLAEELLESKEQLCKYLSKIDLSRVEELIKEIELVQNLVVAARGLKAQFGLSAARDVRFYFKAEGMAKEIVACHLRDIKHLLWTQFFEETEEGLELPVEIVELGTLYINMAGSLDVGAEKRRLRQEIENLERLIAINKKKLQNEDFLERAPEGVIEGAKKLLGENVEKKEELEAIFLRLSAIE